MDILKNALTTGLGLLLSGGAVYADTLIQSTGDNQSWLNPIWGTSAGMAGAGNDYVMADLGSMHLVRSSPAGATAGGNASFPGDSLTVIPETRFLIKQLAGETATLGGGDGALNLLSDAWLHFGGNGGAGTGTATLDLGSLNLIGPAQISVNNGISEAYIAGTLTGTGDANFANDNPDAQRTFTIDRVDGYTGSISIGDRITLNLETGFEFPGSLNLAAETAQLNIPSGVTLSFSESRLSANGTVIAAGTYSGTALNNLNATLGATFFPNLGGTLEVRSSISDVQGGRVSLALDGTNITLSWPNEQDFRLQRSGNSLNDWVSLTDVSSPFTGSVPASVSTTFYRTARGGPGIFDEDDSGAGLWLHYQTVTDVELLQEYRSYVRQIVVEGTNVLAQSTRDELTVALSNLLEKNIVADSSSVGSGALIVGTPASSPLIAGRGWDDELNTLAQDGYIIRSSTVAGNAVIVIAGNTEAGALYGAFHFLRLLQMQQDISALNITDQPAYELRMYQDWANWDGSVERGYAGNSIVDVNALPDTLDARNRTLARSMAALGLNGQCINNVNAQSDWIDTANLSKIEALAAVRREYGIRLFLSVRFDSPIVLGGLDTADPLDPSVINWWNSKVSEIYSVIPDFGGFVVKADSEGQPGPTQYGRTHAEGANMLAAAMQPHGGLVLWRAFVYDVATDPDRVKRPYKFYQPLDGRFATNVILQVKNGPMDFQTREPIHPCIGGMSNTQVGLELQITQEYLGQDTHLVWLVPQWKSYLDFETEVSDSRPDTVKDVIAGKTYPHTKHAPTLFAGVSNMGLDDNWTGHPLAQANQYGFGRLAWNPDLSVDELNEEWVRVTYGNDPMVVSTIKSLLLNSWKTYENYTLVGSPTLVVDVGTHFAPDFEFRSTSYFHADSNGVGFDRTRETGSAAVDQYAPSVADRFNDPASCPPEFLLWFHHVSYTHEVYPDKSVIQWIYDTHFDGEAAAANQIDQWNSLRGRISPARFNQVLHKLYAQLVEADKWRRAANSFFWNYSRIPDEQGRDVGTP